MKGRSLSPRMGQRALLLLLTADLAGCATPTVITVDVYTEVPCAKDAEVLITLADQLDALEDSAPSSSSNGCLAGEPGHVGKVVLAPAGDDEKQVAFAVTTRSDGGPADECLASPLPPACIVARRQLRFVPHLELPMRIDLRDACSGVDCPADQTCVKGSCVSAVVPDDCTGGCDDSQLPPASGGPARLTGAGGPVVRIVATKTGFAAAWPATEADGGYAVRLQMLSSSAQPSGSLSAPIASSKDPIEDLILGYDGTSYGLAVRSATTSFLMANRDGAVIAGPATVDGVESLPTRGLPWNGAHFALVVNGTTPGEMSFKFYDNQAIEAGYGSSMTSGTVGSAAWDGSQYFAATYVESGARCSFFYTPDSAAFPGFATLADDCDHMAIAPRAGGGWHVAYQTQSAPARVYYAAIASSGTIAAGPTQVSLGDGESYGAAQVVDTGSGAAVFFAASTDGSAPLQRAGVDAAGKLVQTAEPVPSVVVASQSYEVAPSGQTVGVVWYGRTDSPGAKASGIYATAIGL